jgi:N-acetylneuraminic acid mutarotase
MMQITLQPYSYRNLISMIAVVLTLLAGAAPRRLARAIDFPWTTLGNSVSGRWRHTLTLLPDGRVLAVGGWSGTHTLASAEIYDPSTGNWRLVASNMSTARREHTATLLPDGRVLVAGGHNVDEPDVLVVGALVDQALDSVEIFDPVSETWQSVSSLNASRYGHTATRLKDGRVLVTGGRRPDVGLATFASTAHAEVFNPATGAWTVLPAMAGARDSHRAVLLPNGKVLVAGGQSVVGDSPGIPSASAQLFDPATNTWATTGAMTAARSHLSLNVLPDGRVLAVGGYGGPASAEAYNTTTGAWSAVASPASGHVEHISALLPNGRVLVAGGGTGATSIYDPGANAWSYSGTLNQARGSHTTVLLPNGDVLVSGGGISAPGPGTTNITERYRAASIAVTPGENLNTARRGHVAAEVPGGLFVIGGETPSGVTGVIERYKASTRSWISVATLNTPRSRHTATVLNDGRILIAGGTDGATVVPEAEIYDPSSNTVSPAGRLNAARISHSAVLLDNGEVLVVGGSGSNGDLASIERFDPQTNTWSVVGALRTARRDHTATLVGDGGIVIVGGVRERVPITSVEYYRYGSALASDSHIDPLTSPRYMHAAILLHSGALLIAGGDNGEAGAHGSSLVLEPGAQAWRMTEPMPIRVQGTRATLLLDGRVLLVGGYNSDGVVDDLLIFDPAMQTWASEGTLPSPLEDHSATLLPNGRVVVAGGFNTDISASSTEIDPGLGANASWRPVLDSPGTIRLGQRVTLTGQNWTGYAQIEAANGASTHHPVIQLRRLDNGATHWLPINSFSSTSANSLLRANAIQPGAALMTVFVNGIPSGGHYTRVEGYTLNVRLSGNGRGRVTSDNLTRDGSRGNVSCVPFCSGKFGLDEEVRLNAVAEPGSQFTGWGGACSGTAGQCSVRLSTDRDVTAVFAMTSATLTVSLTGAGDGMVSSSPAGIDCGATCAASFPIGRVVTLTASPARGSAFAGWGGACSGTGTCIVTLDAARTVTAGFAAATATPTATAGATATDVRVHLPIIGR